MLPRPLPKPSAAQSKAKELRRAQRSAKAAKSRLIRIKERKQSERIAKARRRLANQVGTLFQDLAVNILEHR